MNYFGSGNVTVGRPMKRKVRRRAYNGRDLAEAKRWAEDFAFTDGDGFGHQLQEDPLAIPQVAELIAKVRRRFEKRIRLIEDAVANAGYDMDAFVRSYVKDRKNGEAFWRC